MRLNVFFLPNQAAEQELTGRTVIVIDILRATTTITQALAAGATRVIPCLEVGEARRIAAARPDAVLGGERQGLRIEGFSLGNSPAEYTPQSVGGRSVVITTTNGTRAMHRCRTARRVLLGAFINLSSIVQEVHDSADLVLLCAGTDEHATQEDVLFAGAVAYQLTAQMTIDRARVLVTNPEARYALQLWSTLIGREIAKLESALIASRGGQNLVALGMHADIAYAARLDATDVIAELDVDRWECRPLGTC